METLIVLLFWGFMIGGIIYYAIKRQEDKKKEDFEDRDN